MAESIVDQVRELHRPVWYDELISADNQQVWLVCRGCNEGPHAEGPTDWPCSTAVIVYTEEEIGARELPSIADCPDHPRAPAIARRLADGSLVVARWGCTHVEAAALDSPDPREWMSAALG